MTDRQALFEKFLNFLEEPPPIPDYVGEEPKSVTPFDPYQMVAEWIALRHEVKQQGKLLLSTQNNLKTALEAIEAEKQSAPNSSTSLTESEQKKLWHDVIRIVDALDQACAHWQEQLESLSSPSQAAKQPIWLRWLRRLTSSVPDESSSMQDILKSNQQGILLIRRSLLEILRQRQVIPIEALGKPFDSKTMYAIGRQASATLPENRIIQEVVRGYMWGDQVLREAQVIVAIKQS